MTNLIAYHNSPAAKVAILAQLQEHYDADAIVKGQYWEEGKGCAVGCTIHSGDHAQYEPLFGIPQELARLKDTIFEGLPNAEAKEWPMQFMGVIRPGADLTKVRWKFLHWLLTDASVNPGVAHPTVSRAVKDVADIMLQLSLGNTVEESAARSAALTAARSAALTAARSAALTAARSAARSAAWSAAWSAESAAVPATPAAAAWSAAWSAESAAVPAESAYSMMARKLLQLLSEA